MRTMRNLVQACVITMAMPAIVRADNIVMITLNPNTAHELMPLINRMVAGQIVVAMVIGAAAVYCCRMIKGKSTPGG